MKIKSRIRDYQVKFESKFDFVPYISDSNFFVVDKKIYELYKDSFTGVDKSRLFVFDAEESNKNVDSVLKICECFTKISAKKNAGLISIGGGITQDVTGFAANILYRGIKWVYFPTTLLAACDSCIGSKTSLNFKEYKNLLGTFFPPSEIIIVSNCFKTLSKNDFASGLGEVVKFNTMSGESALAELEKDLDALIKRDSKMIDKYVLRSLTFKKPFVEEDEFDTDKRVFLNFAHTFGHAIETASKYEIPHGIAVAVGMLIANKISLERNLLPQKMFDRILALVKKIVQIDLSCVKFAEIIGCIKQDKKQISSDIRAILMNRNYKLSIEYVTEEEINEAFRYVFNEFGVSI